MHPSTVFRETDRPRLERLVRDTGLAVVIGCGSGGPVAAHAPILLAGEALRFHLSSANVLCEVLRTSPGVLAVVTGPDAYISPDWYGSPDQVPTWNYVSAEIAGPVSRLGRAATIALLDDLAAHFEAALAPKPAWTRAKMAPARFEALVGAITAYELRIERCEGMTKLSQNKTAAERAHLANALAASPDPGARRLAGLMSEGRPIPS